MKYLFHARARFLTALALVTFAAAACASTASAAEIVQLISSADTNDGWGRAAQVVPSAFEGSGAVRFVPSGGETSFLGLDFLDTGVDLTTASTLAFRWRVEGQGLTDFKIKVRNYPLVGGMEAIYSIWDSGSAPDGWQLAVVDLSSPLYDDWGGAPDLTRRYITFRTEAAEGSSAVLYLDRVVAVAPTFEWDVGTAAFDATAGPDADFDVDGEVGFSDFLMLARAFGSQVGDTEFVAAVDLDGDQSIGFADFVQFADSFGNPRGRWHIPVTLQSLRTDSLEVELGSGTLSGGTTVLGPGGELETMLELPNAALVGRDSADAHPLPIWAQVRGVSETRQDWTAFVPQEGLARTWTQFVVAAESGEEPVLPDFSYAGYTYFARPVPEAQGTVFDVTAYGAVADDGTSDHAAIERAIDAAESAGGGILFFPPGTFLVNTDTDPRTSIVIRGDNIVLKGSGSREGGTVIKMVNHLPPTEPQNLWTSPYMFIYKPSSTSDAHLATVTRDAARETFWVDVDNTSKLYAGQRITLTLTSLSAVSDFLYPYSPEPEWTSLIDTGVRVREKHTVAEVGTGRIRLAEPLHARVRAAHGWSIREYKHTENVGVEDICFVGSWKDDFVHHKDAIHDGGWSAVQMTRVVNGWVRRVSFVDWNRPLHLGDCSAFSVYHVTQAGNKGHSSISCSGGYGVWVGLSEDLAGHHHGPGTSSRSVGTVYWRYDMQYGQRVDAHGAQPYANLLDCVNGGILYGSGASIENLPNHLKHYVLWNFRHGGSLRSYDFWRPGARDRFVDPIIVGLHGEPVSIASSSTQVLESLGHPVEPESLFEAQLQNRAGETPAWLDDMRQEWDLLRQMPLPELP